MYLIDYQSLMLWGGVETSPKISFFVYSRLVA